MKKLIIAWIAATALVSLSACTTANKTNGVITSNVTNTPPVSQLPFRDSYLTKTTRSGLPPPDR